MAKNKYLIFQNMFNFSIYKINGNELLNITSEILEENNTTLCCLSADRIGIAVAHTNKIEMFAPLVKDYPFEWHFKPSSTAIINFVATHYEYRVDYVIDAIKEKDSSPFYIYHYSALKNDFNKTKVYYKNNILKKTQEFVDDVQNLFSRILGINNKIYIISELEIISFGKEYSDIPEILNIIEKRIRSKYLFLVNFESQQLTDLCFTILYQIIFEKVQEFAYMDYCILLDDEDVNVIYNGIVNVFNDRINEIMEKNSNAYFIFVNENKYTKKIFEEIFKKYHTYNIIDFESILMPLIKYTNLNNRFLDIVNGNGVNRFTNVYLDRNVVKMAPHLKKNERLEFLGNFDSFTEFAIKNIIIKKPIVM